MADAARNTSCGDAAQRGVLVLVDANLKDLLWQAGVSDQGHHSSGFEDLFPSHFPGCLTDGSGCDDENAFDLEADDLPGNSVTEPNTLLLMGTGLVAFARRMTKLTSIIRALDKREEVRTKELKKLGARRLKLFRVAL